MKTVVLSVYSKDTLIESIAETLGPEASELHFWALDAVIPSVARWTRGVGPGGKAALYNRLLARRDDFDLLLCTDDDITFPPRFLTEYTRHVADLDLDLAQ